MRLASAILIIAVALISASTSAQVQIPKYLLQFEFSDVNGVLKDTVVSRLKHANWAKKEAYPEYVKWKNYPFAVRSSSIHGIGLFTDSTSSFNANDFIGFAFVKKNSTGDFNLDYVQTNLGSYINDSSDPNAIVEITALGLVIKALSTIPPNTEITASYQAIIDLFNGDKNVENAIRYW